jgi:hypothetical protein
LLNLLLEEVPDSQYTNQESQYESTQKDFHL